jgi:biopolymer transport protein ExbD
MADPGKRQPKTGLDTQVEMTETVHHEMTRQKRPKERGVRQLNLTSMLDVTFQPLIFFILTANFAVDEGVLAADLPQGVSEQPPIETVQDDILIRVFYEGFRAGLISVRGADRPINSFQDLTVQMEAWRRDGLFPADNKVIIQPHPDARWEHVVAAFNGVVRAKFTNVQFSPAVR